MCFSYDVYIIYSCLVFIFVALGIFLSVYPWSFIVDALCAVAVRWAVDRRWCFGIEGWLSVLHE